MKLLNKYESTKNIEERTLNILKNTEMSAALAEQLNSKKIMEKVSFVK